MWVLGTIVMLIVGAAVTGALGWTPRATPSPPLWDIPALGSTVVGHTFTFAGFTLTAAIFVAGLDVARPTPEFATVFGMMLISFLMQVVAGWIFISLPNLARAEDASALSLAVVLGNTCATLGVSFTWLALAPLMEAIGLISLADVFIWPLLFMVLAAICWVALVAYRLTLASPQACLTIPVLGLGLPALYRLVAIRQWPTLWPGGGAALHFAFVALGVAGLIYALYLGLLVAHGNKDVRRRLQLYGHRIALLSSQVYVLAVALTWIAVALP